ncbi:hypothetical protein ABZ297_43575 [Nonomuraea sp. NPDC005983]|uniref:hypothetical protein n=1 Tax=Nonomuraea sp. NPDC005983 TaxID=3155595 RepID=UPI0033BB11C7
MDDTGRIGGLPEIVEREIGSPWQGFLAEPRDGGRSGVLVLSGSSGRIERERCRVLAAQGVTALSIRWFGGPGQAPGICEIPLETFTAAIDLLRERGLRRISALGLSKGAEAVLLLATLDQRLDAVIAISPTSVAWANVGAGLDGVTRPQRSSWTWRGVPVPYVAYDEGGMPEADAALGAAAWPHLVELVTGRTARR